MWTCPQLDRYINDQRDYDFNYPGLMILMKMEFKLIMWQLPLMNQMLVYVGYELLGTIMVSKHGARAPNFQVEK